MSKPSSTISDPSAYRLPSTRDIGTFDGKTSAKRWLTQLTCTFRNANNGQDASPNVHIQAIDMSLVGGAAAFSDSSDKIQTIVSRAEEGIATSEDLEAIQHALRERFPPTFVEEEIESRTNTQLQQAADEVLAAYYARVHRVLRRAGGRDKPVTASNPLSVLENHTLQDFVSRFINGLFDKTLMQEAISQNALAADSLRQANECVKQAALVLEAKAGHAKLDAQNAKVSMMEELIRVQSGCSVDEALARCYNLSPRFLEAIGSQKLPSTPMDSFYTQLQPSLAQLGTNENWRNPMSQRLQAVPSVSHQQAVNRVYQEPNRPFQYQSNQQRYKYNTQAPCPSANTDTHQTQNVEPVLPSPAESTNQHFDKTASLLRKHDLINEPVTHATPADAVVGARYAPVEAESSSSILPFRTELQYGSTLDSSAESADQQVRVEEMANDEVTRKLLATSSDQASQTTRKPGMQRALSAMTLLSEAVPHKTTRYGMSIGESLSEGAKGPTPLVQEKTVKKDARALSKNWVHDWKILMERFSVPISLLHLWQTSSNLPRQFRRLSLRITYPRQYTRKKRKKKTCFPNR
ncbi:hypothetical protein E4U23_000596 [Claviceps purpurea]|nr:hypothetical protein E4U23_000596 [Claviceps purpurea]